MKRLTIVFLLILQATTILKAQEVVNKTEKWRIGVSMGTGYLMASTKETAKAFEQLGVEYDKAKKGVDKLKWQLQFGGDIHYLFQSGWGIGLKYQYAQSDGNINDLVININGDGLTNVVGDINFKYLINYIGPSFFTKSRIGNSRRLFFTGLFSMGYSHLRIEQTTLDYPLLGTSSSAGLFTSLGLEYYLKQYVSLGCDLGVFGSSFKKIKYNNGYDTWKTDLGDSSDNISNLNLSFNIRFYL